MTFDNLSSGHDIKIDIKFQIPPSQKSRVKQVNDKGQPAPFECLEDEIPYASLCSLAIYKLYEDWTSDGVDLSTEMYEFRGSGRILARSNIEASN